MLDSELFLPESWDADRERCRAADIPDELHYRPKWQIALELLRLAERNGWRFDWLTFDEGYGSKPGFLQVLDLAAGPASGKCPRHSPADRVKANRLGLRRGSVRPTRGEEAGGAVVPLARQTGPEAVWQAKAVDGPWGTTGGRVTA